MSRLRLLLAFALAACGGPSPSSVCEDSVDVLEHCIEENSYSSYSVSTDVESCEENLEDCTEEDLELVDEYLDCFRDSCDAEDCYDTLIGVDPECLGYGTSY